ncbi:G domain-containing protein [Pleurotus pulmonarius]
MSRVSINDIKSDDKIIAIMGPTGAGKSTFIDTAMRQGGRAGHTLKSYTANVEAVRYNDGKDTIVFVDTPGFDDTTRSDTDILKLIANWLEKTYKKHVLLTGIIYVHRITDNRMSGSPLKNLHMFGSLCGEAASPNVILITTMWSDKVPADVGGRREAELVDKFWKPMLDLGSAHMRFMGSYESAWEIVRAVIARAEARPVLLQQELVDLHKVLRETEAGKTLYGELLRLLEEQKRVAQQLREVSKQNQNNPALQAELDNQFKQIDGLLNTTLIQIQEMKIPFVSRLKSFFSGKKAATHPVRV